MRVVLIGDGQSPHLLKWARALGPRVDLFAVSSRNFLAGFDAIVPAQRRLALDTSPAFEGGNFALLRCLPRLGAWLRRVRPDWLHAHYLTSHGTLAWLARALWRVPVQIVGSAWGSDILVAPERSVALRLLTSRVLRACMLATSDSQFMAERMRALGATEVMVFPFGLERLPPPPGAKLPRRFFANRGLEPIYAPQRVVAAFAAVARTWPDAELVIANDGSMRDRLQAQVETEGLGGRVRFVGRLSAESLEVEYRLARWYLSLPTSDSVSVSVLEAMAHGCIPLLSDLPANRELVRDGENGLIVPHGTLPSPQRLADLQSRAEAVARANHDWVAANAMFEPAVDRFVDRLRSLQCERRWPQ
jgi:glycosyltransferase involved in cell wall biosynthesis